ncbi:NAD(P)-binding protein [Cyathus striatus]|nr:NAD(P)-binding protein [Cyathus striatus]
MYSLFSFLKRHYTLRNPPQAQPSPDSPLIKFGIIGAAEIGPLGLILPARSHPEAVVLAVAARSKEKAKAYAKKHAIPKAYGGRRLLDDPEIDVIYNPLPNGLHYEWTMKALNAGKHVLLEKPATDTAEEARKIFELAEKKGLVVMEAFHYRFHPAVQYVKVLIESGELGKLKSVSASLVVPKMFKDDDIRFDYALGGGGLMDMGCYVMNCIRYLSSSNPTSVLTAEHIAHTPRSAPSGFKPNVDRGTSASFAMGKDVTADIACDLGVPYQYGLIPTIPKVTAIARTKKVYTFADGGMAGKGEEWWTTYRYQLEAFIDKVQGREPQTWVSKEDTIGNMEWIEKVYEKTGLGSRPGSGYIM